MTFKVTIEGRTTSISTWVTNEIQKGQLILGSGVLEDLDLQLYDVPDILSLSGHAEDTRTLRNPCGSSPVTRSSQAIRRETTNPQSYPPNDFLLPLHRGFHREIVIGGDGKWRIYYLTPDQKSKIRSKKDAVQHMKNFNGITTENFNFQQYKLDIKDPHKIYQSMRHVNPGRRSTSHNIPQGLYQSIQSNDSAPSAGENQDRYREEDHSWDQNDDTANIKVEFYPEPYNTGGFYRGEWRSSKYFSSDETEEEAMPYKTQGVDLQDNVDYWRRHESQTKYCCQIPTLPILN